MDKIDLRYQRGKIYTVRCYDDDSLIYVGSTIDKLSARMSKHRYNKTCSLYQYVNGNWKNWYIELYEEYPCNNKEELNKKEGEITRLIGNINKRIEGRTKQEWREANKEHVAEQQKKWREDNKKHIVEYFKKHYENNKEQISEYNKEYRNANKEQIAEQQKKHYENNKEQIVERSKEHYENNKEQILERLKQKVICEHCGFESRKNHLKRHQKSKKCLEKQNIIIK